MWKLSCLLPQWISICLPLPCPSLFLYHCNHTEGLFPAVPICTDTPLTAVQQGSFKTGTDAAFFVWSGLSWQTQQCHVPMAFMLECLLHKITQQALIGMTIACVSEGRSAGELMLKLLRKSMDRTCFCYSVVVIVKKSELFQHRI